MSKRNIGIVVTILALLAVGVGGYLYFNKPISATSVSIPYEKPTTVSNFNEEYDVIVIGGEPEGVAAAVSAARNGAKTLLIENRAELGGLFTYGMLNFLDIPQGGNGKSVSRGIYQEWHKLVGAENAFVIEQAKAAFKKLVDEEENLTLTVKTNVKEPLLEGNQVVAVKVENEFGEFTIKGKSFIDATQDADFAVMSGAPSFVGGEDIGIADKKMAVTLMIHLNNVDWKKVKQVAKSEKFGFADMTRSVAWGFTDLHDMYEPVEENTRLRGLNLVKLDDDYYINALQIFGIDGLSEQSKQEAIEIGKRETEHILSYLQKEFPGFEEATIASFPTELYVRETRHIWAEYQLSMADVWMNKDHWDSIGLGAYPVDVQAQTPHDYGYVISDPKQYAIPFRSLVPKEIDGLLVAGRSTGYSSLAAGSARVVPTGMVTGEAAGAAAVLANKENITFRELSQNKELIETLRTTLKNQGAYVSHFDVGYPYKGEWYDESIQMLVNYGLVVGGYTNELPVDDPATKHSFINMLNGAVERVNPEKTETIEKMNGIYAEVYGAENSPLEINDIVSIVSRLLLNDEADMSLQRLVDEGILSEETSKRLDSSSTELTFKEMYAVIAEIMQYQQR